MNYIYLAVGLIAGIFFLGKARSTSRRMKLQENLKVQIVWMNITVGATPNQRQMSLLVWGLFFSAFPLLSQTQIRLLQTYSQYFHLLCSL